MSQDTATAPAASTPAEAAPAPPAAKPETPATPSTPASVTFDKAQQDKVNDIVAATERATAAKYAEAVKAQAELEKIREAQASDQEKAVAAATKEAEKATTAKFHGVLVDSQAQVIASSLGFHNPAVAVATLRGRGDLDGVKVSDEGVVDTTAVTTALETLAAAETYLVKAPATPPTAAGVGLGGATGTGGDAKPEYKPGMDRLRGAYDQIDKSKHHKQ